jgi:hypothetical protein
MVSESQPSKLETSAATRSGSAAGRSILFSTGMISRPASMAR